MRRGRIIKIRVFDELEERETLKLKYFIFKTCQCIVIISIVIGAECIKWIIGVIHGFLSFLQ
jgi:hypothetical protein